MINRKLHSLPTKMADTDNYVIFPRNVKKVYTVVTGVPVHANMCICHPYQVSQVPISAVHPLFELLTAYLVCFVFARF